MSPPNGASFVALRRFSGNVSANRLDGSGRIARACNRSLVNSVFHCCEFATVDTVVSRDVLNKRGRANSVARKFTPRKVPPLVNRFRGGYLILKSRNAEPENRSRSSLPRPRERERGRSPRLAGWQSPFAKNGKSTSKLFHAG